MAHGYAIASGKVPAVMVHVSVGTANALCGIFNAAREYVPILLTAGRSPITEEGMFGARDTYIHWAQEMFDQAGMLREIVKWDYELRNGTQLETVIDRALSLATSAPEGPVYLSLPREVLGEPINGLQYDSPSRRTAVSSPGADEAAVDAAAAFLAKAKRPVIITGSAGRDPAAVAALAAFAERFAIPVVEHRQRHVSLSAEHPCHLGYDPAYALRASTKPTRSSSSSPTCRGCPSRASNRPPSAASSISGSTRSMRATRSAGSRATSRSPGRRVWCCPSLAQRLKVSETAKSPRVVTRWPSVARRNAPTGESNATKMATHRRRSIPTGSAIA